MRKKLVKLPGGKVVAFRPAPIAKYLAGSTSTTLMQHRPVSVSPPPLPPAPQENPTHPTTSDSNRQVMDISILEEANVLIIGCGAVGSYIAHLLAAVTSLVITIIDFDVIEYKHTQGARTIFEAGQVRKKKVYAAKEKIERDYPLSIVNPYPYNVLDLPAIVLTQLAKKAAIVINAIDSGDGMLRINDLFYSIVEVLYVAAHRAAASGHIITTAPFATACLRCCMDIESADDIRTLHAEPGLGVDIRIIAHHCVTIALELMFAKATGQPIERWDVTRNIFYIANRQQQHSPDGPGVIMQQGHKRPGCPICSTAVV